MVNRDHAPRAVPGLTAFNGAPPKGDDADSLFEADINALAAAGITTGCADGRFCPSLTVDRGQMAAFLHRGLGR
ncbi:MAG: S-layer homology domain-containing protein [Candidatus Limnocylindria bacterium]